MVQPVTRADCAQDPPLPTMSNKMRQTREYHAGWLGTVAAPALAELRNNVSNADPSALLVAGAERTCESERFLDHLLVPDVAADRCPVRFSERFSALWVRRAATTMWFCVVDGVYFVFALRVAPAGITQLAVSGADGTHHVPCVSVPPAGVRWTELQQHLVDCFESDDHVRAIAAAIMLSCTAAGEYCGAARALLPSALRHLETKVIYVTPIDQDLMTVLADAKTTNEELYLDCGGGYAALSTMKGSVSQLTRIERPARSELFEESADQLMPLIFS